MGRVKVKLKVKVTVKVKLKVQVRVRVRVTFRVTIRRRVKVTCMIFKGWVQHCKCWNKRSPKLELKKPESILSSRERLCSSGRESVRARIMVRVMVRVRVSVEGFRCGGAL